MGEYSSFTAGLSHFPGQVPSRHENSNKTFHLSGASLFSSLADFLRIPSNEINSSLLNQSEGAFKDATLPETKIAPEKGPFQKETIELPSNHRFSGANYWFGMVWLRVTRSWNHGKKTPSS